MSNVKCKIVGAVICTCGHGIECHMKQGKRGELRAGACWMCGKRGKCKAWSPVRVPFEVLKPTQPEAAA